jgi:hypothetical protein
MMSRSLSVFLFLFFVLFVEVIGVTFSNTCVAQISYQVLFSKEDFAFKKENGFDLVSLKAGSLNTDGDVIKSQATGSPDLPIKLIHLLLPPNSDVAGVSVTGEHHILLPGEFLISPCQVDEKTDSSCTREWMDPDPVIYGSDSSYPGKLVETVDEGYLGGNHLITLGIYPLQYKPKSRQLSFYIQMDINVELRPSSKLPLSSPVQGRSVLAQKMYAEILYQLVDNKNDISSLTCSSSPYILPKANIESSISTSYLVITSSGLKSAFLPLVEWKTKKGVKAAIICMDSILSTHAGRDDAEKLRNFLIEAYQNGVSWVLLGGDEDVVPIRYVYPTNTSTPPEKTNQQICDLYFSDIDGEWDLDNDGIWGEPQEDRPDLFPDLFVGRVPCGDITEANAFVQKLLTYEKNPGNGTANYLVRALWMSSDQMRDYDSGTGQHNLVSPYIPSSFSQDLSSLIESPTGSAENPIGPDGGISVDMMNQGWGIIGVLAHGKSSGFVSKSNLTNGTPKSWVLTVSGENDGHGHLPNLGNQQKYGIMYSIACSQSAIDVDKYPSLGGEPCVGEFYPLVSQKGGVAFLGYTRWGWVGLSYLLFEKFLEYLSSGNPKHHIGVAEALSRCAYPAYRDIDYGHNLFGDPEMSVWTALPSHMTVSHPDEVSMGEQNIDFSVTSGGTGVVDARVCLTLRGTYIFLGETDVSGHLSAEVNLNDAGEMSVVVTKPNFIPYEDSILVTISAGVDEGETSEGIESFELSQNYPNPFNPVTSIQYSVGSRQTKAVNSPQSTVDRPIPTTQKKAVDSSPFTVHSPIPTTLKIYNILGQNVRTLVDESKMPGNYEAIWDGKDSNGKDVSSGIYFYTLVAGDCRSTKKMTLIK